MDDIYLNLAVELYENGTWNKEMFEKKVLLYAKDKGIEDKDVNEFINRVFKPKEMTIDEKKEYLSKVTFDGVELKYGDVIEAMSDETIEKFYELEMSRTNVNEIPKKEEKIAELDETKEEVVEPGYINEQDSILKVSVEDIKNGNYSVDDILGITEKDADELFEALVNVVKPDDFNKVVYSLRERLGKDYSSTFAIAWAKKHSNDMDKVNLEEKEEVSLVNEEKEEVIIDSKEETLNEGPNMEEVESNEVVIPKIEFEESDMPETEEEFVNQAENITKKETDSNVKIVSASPERINKLKKNKGKIINYFLKTTIVVAAVTLLTFPSAATTIGGYLYFSNRIKNGNFNPGEKNLVGKAIKSVVEKVMYMGMNKEEIENEKGKSR